MCGGFHSACAARHERAGPPQALIPKRFKREATHMKRAAVDAALAALADPTRRAVVDLLLKRPYRASDLASALAISPPAMSRHLRQLRQGGLVVNDEHEHDARVRLYRLRPEGFASLQRWVDSIGALWQDQLAAFKAHAESRARRP
jgi:DNA-binding transcriptional ArsR family regulator